MKQAGDRLYCCLANITQAQDDLLQVFSNVSYRRSVTKEFIEHGKLILCVTMVSSVSH